MLVGKARYLIPSDEDRLEENHIWMVTDAQGSEMSQRFHIAHLSPLPCCVRVAEKQNDLTYSRLSRVGPGSNCHLLTPSPMLSEQPAYQAAHGKNPVRMPVMKTDDFRQGRAASTWGTQGGSGEELKLETEKKNYYTDLGKAIGKETGQSHP